MVENKVLNYRCFKKLKDHQFLATSEKDCKNKAHMKIKQLYIIIVQTTFFGYSYFPSDAYSS